MSARSDAVANWMRRLSWISAFGNASTNQTIEIRKTCAVARVGNSFVKDLEQQIKQFVILRREVAGADILGEVSPVAVHAHPDFKKCRFILLDRPVTSGCKGRDAFARPNQSEGACHLHFALVADAEPVHEALIHAANLAFFHTRAHVLAGIFHGERQPVHWPGACARFPEEF